MDSKLFHAGIGLVSAGTLGITLAIIMEIMTGEPVYFLIMKLTAILFGLGGPLLGIAIARRRK